MTTKIVCAYHETVNPKYHPIILKYPDIFLPVLGGACFYKTGTKKFFDQMQRDDDGENVSFYNPYINELTTLYWAYKHYRTIGNPDIIGLCHYRRFMDVDYDNLDPDKIYGGRILSGHAGGILGLIDDFVRCTYANFCSDEILELYLDAYRNALPEYNFCVDLTLEDMAYYSKNMFIMNRANFFDFMDYICRVLRVMFDEDLFREASSIFHPDMHIRRLMLIHSRCRGFLMEMFTSIWFERQHLLRQNVIPTKLIEIMNF